ncbi:TIGR02594 family protein [Roseobacter sp. MED193]|uniref:NlpC/P60 family protein n=1 Tax=Roseobacter sp. MED193 TaxID=314262 RepID=UPI000587716C|nr:TIGR02594 family protein [Roseobacter sp. MED193]
MFPSDWKKVQKRLMKLGFNPGPVDGIRGKMTSNAIRRFQQSVGLLADGIVGPMTYAALFGPPATGQVHRFDRMPWFDEANRLMGTKEIPGPMSNPQILKMAEDLDIDYDNDDIPWCGLFVGHCVGSTLVEEPLPANLLGARQWLKFGEPVSPQIGAILVFWRGKKDGWKGHVAFCAGEDKKRYYCLGGNQSNTVNVTKISKSRLLGARWPLTGPDPAGLTSLEGIVAIDGDGNEE